MDDLRAYSPTIAIAGQPTADDLRTLAAEGYVGVVNLRNDGEPDQPMSIADEGEVARSLGLDYLHVGVGAAPLTPEGVGSVCGFLDEHAGRRVLVHCRSGGRVGALLLIREATARGWSAEEAVAAAPGLGLPLSPGLSNLVQQYLTENPTA